MAQKFIGLEDAAKQLGVKTEQLQALRESNKLRAYRDGASWKFRTEDIEKLAETGLPSGDASDDGGLSLDELASGLEGDSIDFSDELSLDLDDLEFDSEPDAAPAAAGAESDLSLTVEEDGTVPADETGDDDEDDSAESILLTDASVGGVSDASPSTIIGRNELSEGDLELASDSGVSAAMSDVELAPETSDDDKTAGPGVASGEAAAQFEGLEELEIDLEAESSRILEAEDVAAAKAAAESNKQDSQAAGLSKTNALDSDLGLAPGSDAGQGASLTGLSEIASGGGDTFELAAESSIVGDTPGSDTPAGEAPGSSAVLSQDEDDDFVLGESSSDVTLSGADSGINLAPSDSGLALDDASLDLAGAAGGSSLDLGESFGAALTDDGDSDDSLASGEMAGSQEFLLQPVAEEDLGDEDDDSSQIIALEEVADEADADVMIGEGVTGFGEEMTPGAVAAAGPVAEEAQFGGLTIGLLACSVATMTVCALLSVDMIRTVWSWREAGPISSDVLNSLANLMGLRP